MNEDTFKAKRGRERLEFLNVRSEFIELENLEIYQKKRIRAISGLLLGGKIQIITGNIFHDPVGYHPKVSGS